MTSNIDLPVFFEVKMGKSIYEMETKSLLSTMTQQFLSSKREDYNADHYNLLFSTTKQEIEDYIEHLWEMDNIFIDLFGNWMEGFHEFQNEKNKVFCRDLIVEFKDGSKWSIKLIDLLSLKNSENPSTFEVDFDDPILKNDEDLIKWVNTLKWNEVSMFAEEIQRPQPETNYSRVWKRSKKEIIDWDKTINILDLMEMTNSTEDD